MFIWPKLWHVCVELYLAGHLTGRLTSRYFEPCVIFSSWSSVGDWLFLLTILQVSFCLSRPWKRTKCSPRQSKISKIFTREHAPGPPPPPLQVCIFTPHTHPPPPPPHTTHTHTHTHTKKILATRLYTEQPTDFILSSKSKNILLNYIRLHAPRSRGVMVSTSDSESGNPSSSLGGTWTFC